MKHFYSPTKQVNLRLPEDLYEYFAWRSNKDHTSISGAIRNHLVQYSEMFANTNKDEFFELSPMKSIKKELLEVREGMNLILSWIDLLVQLNAGIGKLLVDDEDQFVDWLKKLKKKLVVGKDKE